MISDQNQCKYASALETLMMTTVAMDQPAPVEVTHGQEFTISLVAVDQVNHTVPNIVIFSSIKSTKNWSSKGQIMQNTNKVVQI